LHSLGVILGRLEQQAVFTQLVQDVLIDGAVTLVSLPVTAMQQVVSTMDRYHLDFDDAYQYVAAERENAILISFDKDFNRTKRGRLTPAQLLAKL
jgi:predicted nucleic acid-binding protein